MPRHGHQLAGGVPHSPHFLQHGATRRPARAVTVAHASSPHSILPRGQGAHARAPCVMAGPPLRRCRCHGSGITSEPAAELSWHRNSFYSSNSGHSGADFVAPLHKHFRGPMYTGTRPCYSEALNLRRGGECGMARCGRPSRIVVNCFRALIRYCCRTMM